MELTRILGSPAQPRNIWQLQHRRTSYCALRDKPIKNGTAVEISGTLSDSTREKLRSVNIRSIDPSELSRLAFTLHHEGYLSHEAWEGLGEFRLDHTELIDPLAEARDSLRSIVNLDDITYALTIEMHEATIDAVVGIEKLISQLNGQILDLYA